MNITYSPIIWLLARKMHRILDKFQQIQQNISYLFNMNFCGWNPNGYNRQQQIMKNPTSFAQIRPNFQPSPSIKISVKNPSIQNQQKNSFYATSQVLNERLKQSQQTNVGSVSKCAPSTQYPASLQISRRDSLIDKISENYEKDDFDYNRGGRFLNGKQSRVYNSVFDKPRLRTEEFSQRAWHNGYSEPHLQQSYADLLKQNLILKKVINEQYKPLKQQYAKLKEQNQDRQFLVSQLQWKVKQLANDVRNRKF